MGHLSTPSNVPASPLKSSGVLNKGPGGGYYCSRENAQAETGEVDTAPWKQTARGLTIYQGDL